MWYTVDINNVSLMLFQMMNNMGGEEDLADLDGADDVRTLLSPSLAFKPLFTLVSKSSSRAEPLSGVTLCKS